VLWLKKKTCRWS